MLTSRSYFDEKNLQGAWYDYFKKNGQWDKSSVEEGKFNVFPELQEHQFLIISDLLEAVTKLNKGLYEQYKSDMVLSEQEFYQQIVAEVKQIYALVKAHTELPKNYLLHQFVFAKEVDMGTYTLARKIEIKKKDGSSVFAEYILVDKNHQHLANNNIVRLVKEKKILANGLLTKDSEEYPDFAIYINGLPAYCIEFKSPTATWTEAWSDYKEKPSYHFFWACIGFDGVNSFVSATPSSSKEPRLWAKYGKRKDEQSYGAKDIVDELICNKRSLVFYAITCLHAIQEQYEGSKKATIFLEALSVQQYYTIWEADQRFAMLQTQIKAAQKRDIIKEVVKHVQRSGKSKTIRGIVTALFTFHNGLFKKVYIQVPDTTIRNQFLSKTFGTSFIVNMGVAKEIKDQQQYIKSITSPEGGLFIMNMQKISTEANKKVYKDDDVLIILDEVHTHQLGENYQIREDNFPNASYISFTATPRIQNAGTDNATNMTNTVYADGKIGYMDEYGSNDAISSNVIIPIVYEKMHYSFDVDNEKLTDFDEYLVKVITNNLLKPTSKMWQDYADKIQDVVTANGNKILSHQAYQELFSEEVEKFIEREKGNIFKSIYLDFQVSHINDKVQWLVNDVWQKRKEVYSNLLTQELYFRTKNFWVVDDIAMATEIICQIKKQYGGCMVNDVRFAVDYSFTTTSDASTIGIHQKHFPEKYFAIDANGNKISTSYALSSLDELNGVAIGSDPILDEFNSTQQGSVDVLIIVGKYIMGYDNPNLVTVYCDTEFSEISRIYQLATRPATKRENKKCGYFVDMGLGHKNALAYKEAILAYEQESGNIQTFVLDENKLKELNNELVASLAQMGQIIGANYPQDFTDLVKLDQCLVKLEQDSDANKGAFFRLLGKINGLLKSLAVPSNYKAHKQAISIMSIAISNFFDLLKAKQIDVVKFTKEDIRLAVHDIFQSLGFKGGINDILDFQISHADELNLNAITVSKATTNKKIVQLKTHLEKTDKYLNKSIYERVKDLLKYCDQVSSVKEQERIIAEIESIKLEHQQQKAKKKVGFTNDYHFVIADMFNAFVQELGFADMWEKSVYEKFSTKLAEEVTKYFMTHKTTVSPSDLLKKIENDYTNVLSSVLPENAVEHEKWLIFREQILSKMNRRTKEQNANLYVFFENLVNALILSFEESTGQDYV